MKSAADDETEQLCSYEKEFRRRANQSIQQLSSTLEQLNHREGRKEEQGLRGNVTSIELQPCPSWNLKAQSKAVNQLKSLLLKQGKETTSAPSLSMEHSPSEQENASIHPSHDLVPMSYNQSEYIQHLEAEVKLFKDELQGLKQRINVVVVENEKLQVELRTKAADESLKDYTLKNSMLNESITAVSHKAEPPTWKNELEHLKVIHKEQIETLEGQLLSLRKDLSLSQRECEELKIRLHQKEKEAADVLRADGSPRVAGLCLKCAQHEAVLADTQGNQHVQTIYRLTKDRDELLVALRAARAGQQEAQQKEWSACFQVKQAVQMVEEANLCKAQMELQCEQISKELAQYRQLSEQECQALQKRLNEARDEGRAEAQKQKEDLAHTVAKLSRDVAELEGQLDRAQRDKSSLSKQLEETLCKLSTQEQDRNKVCADLRYQLSQAQMKRDEAESAIGDLYVKNDREMERTKQEVERLGSELVGCRQQLEAVQKDVSQWQAKAMSLAEQLAGAQHQLHLTRQKIENAERSHNEEMASVTLSAQEKQRELAVLLEQTEAGHQQRATEAESLLANQNSLIRKLKKACCTLFSKLEELTGKSRSKLQQLHLEKQHLEETVKSLRARCSDMEDQCVQHGLLQQRMKARLQQLDHHCRSSAQQVCELLAKQSQLMQERKMLSEELRNQHTEVPNVAHTLSS
ncbi:serologically defined colon cancer antigen 8 homolog isoform X2 [Takifugu rubripes]|uniref:serologically defined colon cancer antigen 8 homolog isoform X2 n=1 Tax=Takifugu rubripes TaxID=31033 RepID=UPI0011455388|nr:serologically defined colon cancer antigen 8 isoform X2 [Takifugu rubripes]